MVKKMNPDPFVKETIPLGFKRFETPDGRFKSGYFLAKYPTEIQIATFRARVLAWNALTDEERDKFAQLQIIAATSTAERNWHIKDVKDRERAAIKFYWDIYIEMYENAKISAREDARTAYWAWARNQDVTRQKIYQEQCHYDHDLATFGQIVGIAVSDKSIVTQTMTFTSISAEELSYDWYVFEKEFGSENVFRCMRSRQGTWVMYLPMSIQLTKEDKAAFANRFNRPIFETYCISFDTQVDFVPRFVPYNIEMHSYNPYGLGPEKERNCIFEPWDSIIRPKIPAYKTVPYLKAIVKEIWKLWMNRIYQTAQDSWRRGGCN